MHCDTLVEPACALVSHAVTSAASTAASDVLSGLANAITDGVRWTVTASVPVHVAFAGLSRLRSAVLGITALLVLVILAGAAGIARTFQNIRLFPSLTVFDNVRTVFHLHLKGDVRHALWRGRGYHAEERNIADQVMELLGVPPGPVVGRALAFLMELRLDEGSGLAGLRTLPEGAHRDGCAAWEFAAVSLSSS